MDHNSQVFSVSDFVAVFNQTLEFAYPIVTIVGELANFRVSKNRWVYFDLKDDQASVKLFGTIYNLPGPMEDGLQLEVRGMPRLHPLYGFSVNIMSIRPVGEGSIKKVANLLEAKLRQEGLFDDSRKRRLPFPPKRIGLITSAGSAAYHDFVKIIAERWGGLEVQLYDVQVQGEAAAEQIVAAISYFNQQPLSPEIIVITRGGGSADDLAVFSTEQVTRAVATSRTPTLVAIGHEIDVSLAELAADQRASTPSNAAQMITPDKNVHLDNLKHASLQLTSAIIDQINRANETLDLSAKNLSTYTIKILSENRSYLERAEVLLKALSPKSVLRRGYAIVRVDGRVLSNIKKVSPGSNLSVELDDGLIYATTIKTKVK